MFPLLAQAAFAGSLGNLVIWAIVIAAIVAIGLTFMNQSGVAIPSWASHIVWIVVVALVAIFAIRLLLSAL